MIRVAFYKSVRPGFKGIYSKGVQIWTRSKYSHCEIIFSDGIAASSSFEDKGVRFKQIDFNEDHWDFIDLPDHYEATARKWFENHKGEKYDILGNVHFVFSIIADDTDKWFCSEAVAASLGILTPERFDPGSLYAVVKALSLNTNRA